MPAIAEARPPYVAFELRGEEDREASIQTGHYVARDVAYALITPRGSKDRIERVAEEWFAQLRRDVDEQRFPAEWYRHFERAYKDWLEGNETPPNGTAVESWPVASPAQIKMMRELHVRTVEDMAEANEEVLHRLGMGARALKQKAIDWLTSAASTGKLGEEMAVLRAECDSLRERNASLEAQLQELMAEVKKALPTTRKL